MQVTTDRGTVRAKVAIVTPSIGVLASGAIAFEPGPSGEMQSALSGLQMGLLNKVVLAYAQSSPLMRIAAGSVLVPQVNGDRGHSFLARPFGAPAIICFVGGSLAWEIAQQGEATAIAFARDRLRALFGADADRGFRAGAAASWGTNPLTLGSYAVAKPGSVRARRVLAMPIGERVFLAGEALAGRAAQTVHGAYQSGVDVARRVLQLLKR